MEQICILFNATHQPIIRKHWGIFNAKTKSYTPENMFADLQTGLADISGMFNAINKIEYLDLDILLIIKELKNKEYYKIFIIIYCVLQEERNENK